MANAAVPADLLQSVVAYFHPRQVILFGSHVRGEAGPDSDIDLVVVLDDDAPREHFSGAAVQEARKGYKRSCDIVLWRRSDFHRRAGIIGSLPYTVLQEGRVIYGEDLEPSAATRMNSVPIDPVAQWEEARRWIAIADQDLRAVAISALRLSRRQRKRLLIIVSRPPRSYSRRCLSTPLDRPARRTISTSWRAR
jgi:predicted nucleotidyltransferase